ncbi:hypothetical protein QBC32DRAFT_223631 [Pseudoneurospora amorphoporcata]|uniref:Uncharacterized protein n=1 Tax=Pseudoneurospora amorphoporcata TaxID=241081 RepID=A0AAN6SC26_9PEZI|nr:hypothetical protein QBC32DRAFT_223631 [Pseudoneurospora amorphoporcata]
MTQQPPETSSVPKWPDTLRYTATVILTCIRFLVTLPYQRLLIYNTVQPAQVIKKLASSGFEAGTTGREELWIEIAAWRQRKRDELQFVAVAATVMTAIITASFSWSNVSSSHWTGPAFWYASLSLCISAIFLSAQQLSLLSLIESKDASKDHAHKPECERPGATRTIRRHLRQILIEKRSGSLIGGRLPPIDIEAQGGEKQTQELPKEGRIDTRDTPPLTEEELTAPNEWRWTFSWRVMFVWQCPIMLITYSTVFYMVGLFVVVCTPVLETRKWGPDSYVAVVYMASLGVSMSLFGICSYGAYDYIHDDHGPGRRLYEELGQRISILSNGKIFSKETNASATSTAGKGEIAHRGGELASMQCGA